MFNNNYAVIYNHQTHSNYNASHVHDGSASQSSEVSINSFNSEQESINKVHVNLPSTSSVNHAKQSINTLLNISDVASLVRYLNDLQETQILWELAAEMASAFLNYNFISASTIAEIEKLKPFMQQKLLQKVEGKFQEMLNFNIDKINECKENIKSEPEIIVFLNNIYLLIKYIKNFSQRQSNILNIFIGLKSLIKNMSLDKNSLQETLNGYSVRREANILISKIIIEISFLELKYYISGFEPPLQELFDYFFNLRKSYVSYLSYLANYTCEALVDIYSSAVFNKDKFISSELAKYTQSLWYIKLCKIKKTIKNNKIKEIDLSVINYLTDGVHHSQRKLFIWGLYGILIYSLFEANKKIEVKEEIFKLLEKVLKEDELLVFQIDFFLNVNMAVEENLFWDADLPKTKQRIFLDDFIINIYSKAVTPSNVEIFQKKLLSGLKDLVSDSIFTVPLYRNYLIKNAKKIIIKNLRQKIHSVEKLHELSIHASAFRFFRHLKSMGSRNTRNIASIKYVKDDGTSRKVVYLIAYSMGVGRGTVILPNEFIAKEESYWTPRGHSEAVLLAAQKVGQIQIEGEDILNLAGFKLEYCASINEPCPEWLEGCKVDLLPSLGPVLYANEYKGSQHRDGFQKKLSEHIKKKSEDETYESEAESETEYEALVLDESHFKGMDLTKAQKLKPAPASHFHHYIEKTDPYYYYYSARLDNYFAEKFFAGYANFGKDSYKVVPIKKYRKIVGLDLKVESEVNQKGEVDELAAAMAVLIKI